MVLLRRFERFAKQTKVILGNAFRENINGVTKNMCTIIGEAKKPIRGIVKFSIYGAGIGVAIGAGYSFYVKNQVKDTSFLEGSIEDIKVLKHIPPYTASRQIVSPVDESGLKLTLFQYQTCPFCCKVRVLLDYYGFSYEIVEVDPVLRKEIKWSTYKKVPILLSKVKNGYQPLNDSSLIISILSSYLHDKNYDIEELSRFYPSNYYKDERGNLKSETINKYFLMQQKGIPKGKTMNDVVEERNWRKWADDVLVHTLSPNVYRTMGEAYETFSWFSKVGKWEEYFPTWERLIMINVGACAMWLISKRLKKKHNLYDDVRQSLYHDVNLWLKAIKIRGTPFMGGQNPDLSDLAVYGILKSIEGCSAFQDLLKNTKLGTWYDAMTEKVDQHAGNSILQ